MQNAEWGIGMIRKIEEKDREIFYKFTTFYFNLLFSKKTSHGVILWLVFFNFISLLIRIPKEGSRLELRRG